MSQLPDRLFLEGRAEGIPGKGGLSKVTFRRRLELYEVRIGPEFPAIRFLGEKVKK